MPSHLAYHVIAAGFSRGYCLQPPQLSPNFDTTIDTVNSAQSLPPELFPPPPPPLT